MWTIYIYIHQVWFYLFLMKLTGMKSTRPVIRLIEKFSNCMKKTNARNYHDNVRHKFR